MQVMVTDGHLPYRFGHEIMGYEVSDLGATLEKARAAGVKILSPRFDAADRSTVIVEFPGGLYRRDSRVAWTLSGDHGCARRQPPPSALKTAI
jgi:hypothetical protein